MKLTVPPGARVRDWLVVKFVAEKPLTAVRLDVPRLSVSDCTETLVRVTLPVLVAVMV